MTHDDAASTTTVISERDQRRILAAMSAMPYAATDRVPTPWVAMGAAVDATGQPLSAAPHSVERILGRHAAADARAAGRRAAATPAVRSHDRAAAERPRRERRRR